MMIAIFPRCLPLSQEIYGRLRTLRLRSRTLTMEAVKKNPLLDIPFYKKSWDGSFKAELMLEDELPADLPQRLQDITVRIYTKVPKLDRQILADARSRCNKKLRQIPGRHRSTPATPKKQRIGDAYGTPSVDGDDDVDDDSGSAPGQQGLVSDEHPLSMPKDLQSCEPEASVTPVVRKLDFGDK